MFDRRLYFVSTEPNTTQMAALNTFITYPRTSGLDKKKYDVGALHGNVIHEDNLFNIYLGESIAPYVALEPLTAVLPVDKQTMTLPLGHNSGEVDTAALDTRMRTRWNTMSALWDANKGKNDNKSLYQNLNYLSKLTNQLAYLRDPGDRPVRIAYTTSGVPTAAIIGNDKAILDTTLYQVTSSNLDEAYYLLAIINSDTLASAVNQFMPKGLFGARHLHKHLWKLPIPAYAPNNTDHINLSRLARRATVEAQTIIANMGTPAPSVTKARAVLRHEWQPSSVTAQAIETAVQQLLA